MFRTYIYFLTGDQDTLHFCDVCSQELDTNQIQMESTESQTESQK